MVPENGLTPPMKRLEIPRDGRELRGPRECVKLNQNFHRALGVLGKIPSLREVWISMGNQMVASEIRKYFDARFVSSL